METEEQQVRKSRTNLLLAGCDGEFSGKPGWRIQLKPRVLVGPALLLLKEA